MGLEHARCGDENHPMSCPLDVRQMLFILYLDPMTLVV